ncbi:MAG: hypothetical protein M3319_07935 [Actinomycetota bacterium]|nr:hypothetical protein [Actinomycetota bacterium]
MSQIQIQFSAAVDTHPGKGAEDMLSVRRCTNNELAAQRVRRPVALAQRWPGSAAPVPMCAFLPVAA